MKVETKLPAQRSLAISHSANDPGGVRIHQDRGPIKAERHDGVGNVVANAGKLTQIEIARWNLSIMLLHECASNLHHVVSSPA